LDHRQSARYSHFNIVGEVFDSVPELVSLFEDGKVRFDGIDSGVDTLFDFPLQNAIDKVFTGATARSPSSTSMTCRVSCIDLALTREALIEAFTFLLITRGIPMLYYGGEVGMSGGDDADNRRDFPSNAFNPAQPSAEQQALFQRFQRLARLSAAPPPLRRGSLLDLLVEDDAYAFVRLTSTDDAPGSRVLASNNADGPATLQVPLSGTGIADGTRLEDLLGAGPPGLCRRWNRPHSTAAAVVDHLSLTPTMEKPSLRFLKLPNGVAPAWTTGKPPAETNWAGNALFGVGVWAAARLPHGGSQLHSTPMPTITKTVLIRPNRDRRALP
jgi:hypothetical protein